MNVIDERINHPFEYDDDRPIPDGVVDAYLNTPDFMRETVRDSEAAASIHEYGLEQVAAPPRVGDGRDTGLHTGGENYSTVHHSPP